MSDKCKTDISLALELASLKKQIIQIFQEKDALQQQAQQAEKERQEALIAREKDRERFQREREQLVLTVLRKMGENRPFILDMLEDMSDPDSTSVIDPRALSAELKRWLQETSKQRATRFPSDLEMPDNLITLTPNELNDSARGFDVGFERPFADGQEQVTFRVVRKGWKLGEYILHPARLSIYGVSKTSTIKEAKQ